ncbi:MAG: hypothetical protein ACRCXD_11315 [Luteolibacter sp.]
MKITVFAWLAAASVLCAQSTPPADPAADRQSVETLNLHLALREKRLAEVTREIMERSQQMDSRIGDLVTLLSGVRDSQASRRVVSQVTAEAIRNLRDMIEIYQRERRTIA